MLVASLPLVAVVFAGPMAAANSQCVECHADSELFEDYGARAESLRVTGESLTGSSHAILDCIDCHADLEGFEDFPHEERLAPVACGSCHEDEAEAYRWHGHLEVGRGEDIPDCADCHGTHDIRGAADRASDIHPLNLPGTCGRCHEDIDLVRKHGIPVGRIVDVFEVSVHGRVPVGGAHPAASCNDCHSSAGTAHQILPPGNTQSTINHFNIPRTCGRCHQREEQDYWDGIHGQLLLRGETGSPACTDCHGEHGILHTGDPRSPVSPARVAEATCTPCHESARLNEKYEIPSGRLQTWIDSYHGLKSKAGDVTVANCASCHGAHRILPSTDSSSSIHPSNVQETCGRCHPGISSTLATAEIHGESGVGGTALARLIEKFYIIAIVVIIGAMVAHWLIDLRKQIKLANTRPQIRRMMPNEVWQHAFLMVTFIVLVITGFALRFSESWWVSLFFGWEGGFAVRGIIHRVAAVIFMGTVLWHILYLLGGRGRRFLVDMRPGWMDFRQFTQMIKYNLGITKERPQFNRFGYVEKAEYWALVWGAALMIVTGFFLWADNLAVWLFPKGFLDVMLVVHYYEAWLASLAILVWHMYSTIFSPAVYPMNPAWYTGTMPLDVYRHEHPDDPILRENPQEKSKPQDDGEVA